MFAEGHMLTSQLLLWQVPRTSEIYVHRSGRTARATSEGLSLMLIGPEDVINFKKIYKTLKKDEDIPLFPVQTKYMDAVKVKEVKIPGLIRGGTVPHLGSKTLGNQVMVLPAAKQRFILKKGGEWGHCTCDEGGRMSGQR